MDTHNGTRHNFRRRYKLLKCCQILKNLQHRGASICEKTFFYLLLGANERVLRRDILSRYEKDGQGSFILDVSARRAEDLYDDFDKSAPYIRRDLDQELATYLMEGARELARVPFKIRFTLADSPDEQNFLRIKRSLNTYFLYLAENEIQKILQMFRRFFIFLGIGLAILFAAVSLNRILGPERSVTANVFAEGLTIAAWVSLWEALAILLVEWFPHRKNVELYRSLAEVQVIFRAKTLPEQSID
jgi:hypothetical protein